MEVKEARQLHEEPLTGKEAFVVLIVWVVKMFHVEEMGLS